jgi:hypothetical protein
MENLKKIVKNLELERNIELEDIPNIDLYMDQVIQLFETTFNRSKRNAEDKILTKTMINNYAKGDLFFPIKNKKYSKEHIILISLIYQLKGALSISDIKATLEGINEKIIGEDFKLDAFYKSYLNLCRQNVRDFNEDLPLLFDAVKEEMGKNGQNKNGQLDQILLIASLVNISNMYRRLAEKLVDEIAD